jgi:hypothetical protein
VAKKSDFLTDLEVAERGSRDGEEVGWVVEQEDDGDLLLRLLLAVVDRRAGASRGSDKERKRKAGD